MNNQSKAIVVLIPVIILIAVLIFSNQKQNQNQQEQTPSLSNPNENVASQTTQSTAAQPQETPNQALPSMQIDKNKQYTAILDTTQGKITIDLYASKTPLTVNNFVSLARKNFYNNTIFHRVIKSFMIQGGDPNGDGTGGPGYQFNDEPFEGEYTRGTIAMANSGPNTNGSQFFIMQQDNELAKNYVIFGKIIEGLDVVDKIADAPVTQNSNGEMSKPINPVTVKSVEIIEK